MHAYARSCLYLSSNPSVFCCGLQRIAEQLIYTAIQISDTDKSALNLVQDTETRISMQAQLRQTRARLRSLSSAVSQLSTSGFGSVVLPKDQYVEIPSSKVLRSPFKQGWHEGDSALRVDDSPTERELPVGTLGKTPRQQPTHGTNQQTARSGTLATTRYMTGRCMTLAASCCSPMVRGTCFLMVVGGRTAQAPI